MKSLICFHFLASIISYSSYLLPFLCLFTKTVAKVLEVMERNAVFYLVGGVYTLQVH